MRIDGTADDQFGTNSYLVSDEETGDAVIIDAHLQPELIVEQVKERGVKVLAILLTHTDVDHVGGLPRLLREFPDIPVAVHDAEREVVAEGRPLRRMFPVEAEPVALVERLEEGVVYRAGSLEFEVLHTPGHSPGGVTLRIANVLFTGDALFAGSIGRSDFDNSDEAALMEGIRTKLMAHPDDFVVLSGHGPASTIGRERKTNPFL